MPEKLEVDWDDPPCYVYGFVRVGPAAPGVYGVAPPDTVWPWELVEIRELRGDLVAVWQQQVTLEDLVEEGLV